MTTEEELTFRMLVKIAMRKDVSIYTIRRVFGDPNLVHAVHLGFSEQVPNFGRRAGPGHLILVDPTALDHWLSVNRPEMRELWDAAVSYAAIDGSARSRGWE